MRKLITAVAAAATLLALSALPAHADSPGGGVSVIPYSGPHGIGYDGRYLRRFPGGGGGGDFGGGDVLLPAPCPGEFVTQNPDGTLSRHDGSNLVPSWNVGNVPLQPGNVWVECVGIGASVTACCAFFMFQVPIANMPIVTPRQLAEELWGNRKLPDPVIEMSPPHNVDQLVYLPVWLWLQPGTHDDVIAGPGKVRAVDEQITVTAHATSVTWTLPDGSPATVTCGADAAVWTPGATSSTCSSKFIAAIQSTSVSATIHWTVTYQATGLIPETGTLAPQDTTTTIPGIHVVQDQTVNAAN